MDFNKKSIFTLLFISLAISSQIYGQATLQLSDEELSLEQDQLETLKTVSGTVKGLLEELGEGEEAIPLPLIAKKDYETLTEYFDILDKPEELKKKTKTLIDTSQLVTLINNASYLDIPVLVKAYSTRIAELLKTDKKIQDEFMKTGKIPALESLTDTYLRNLISQKFPSSAIFRSRPGTEKGNYLVMEEGKLVTPVVCPAKRMPKFSPDGKFVATLSPGGNVILILDAQSGKILRELKSIFARKTRDPKLRSYQWKKQKINSIDFSPDSNQIMGTSEDLSPIAIWDIKTGNLATKNIKFKSFQYVPIAKFSPDGTKIAASIDEGTFGIFNALTGEPLFKKDLEWSLNVDKIEFSPDGNRVLTRIEGIDVAIIWDANTGKQLHSLKSGKVGTISDASFSPDATKVITAYYRNVAIIWDSTTADIIQTLKGHKDKVETATFSPDGTKVVTASRDETAIIWNANTGEQLQTLTHEGGVNSANFNFDGSKVITASNDQTTKIWDTTTGKLLDSLPNDATVKYAIFSPNGNRMLTFSSDCVTQIWKPSLQYQTIEQALVRYLITKSDDPKQLLNAPALQKIIADTL